MVSWVTQTKIYANSTTLGSWHTNLTLLCSEIVFVFHILRWFYGYIVGKLMVYALLKILILSKTFPTSSQVTQMDNVFKCYAPKKFMYQLTTVWLTKLLVLHILASYLGTLYPNAWCSIFFLFYISMRPFQWPHEQPKLILYAKVMPLRSWHTNLSLWVS